MARELMIRFTYTVHGGREASTAGRSATMVVGSDGTTLPVAAGRMLGVSLDREGDAWRLTMAPSVDVEVGTCTATTRLDLASFDAVYHNGYQSWTDSVEHPPSYTMPGLAFAPGIAVRNWALDGSGDYRFAHYEPSRGFQHGFGYCWVRRGEHYLFAGSLGEDSGLTTTYTSMRRGTLFLEREAPARIIRAGETHELISFAMLEGTLDECLGTWLELAGIQAIPAPGIVGFSSWYRHYDDIDEGKLIHDLRAMRELFRGVDTGDCRRIFQIDDGYATVGDWLRPHSDRFPSGMAAMAERISEAGFVPGLWMAPFVCSADSLLFRYHPDWLLRDDSGATVMTGSHWNGAYALDTLNPEVRAYIRESLSTATREWGYRLLKLDFLYGACMLPHGGMNRGELIADALELLRESVDEGVVFDMCGVPLMSAFGRTEYCRIGCDVGLDWDDALHMRLLHRERVSTKNSLANTIGRAHLDGRVFRNDPDVFFLRDDVRLTDKQRASLLRADSLFGGVFFTSDNVEGWSYEARMAWRSALARFVEQNPFQPEPEPLAESAPAVFDELAARLAVELDASFGPHEGGKVLIVAPGRTEIAGNHTDHEGGHVIAGAVDRYLYGVAALNGTGGDGAPIVRVKSAGYEPFEMDLSSLEPRSDERGTSQALIRGLAACMDSVGYEPLGFDLVLESDVPAGSGLSSSAAFELAIARAMDILWADNSTPALELALMSQRSEREWFGKPCGLMDQASVALGGIQHMDFSGETARADRIDFDFASAGYAICLVAVGESHADLIDEYAAVPGEMIAVARALGGERLSDVDEDQVIDAIPRLREELGDRAVLRALHFFREERLVASRARALSRGDIDAFLEMESASGTSSATLLQNVSAPSATGRDQSAQVAIALADELLAGKGASRIHGGGFGGTIQVFVPLDHVEWFRARMEAVFGEGACMICGIDHEGARAEWL